MRKLFHYPLCPFSRQIRLLLREYDVNTALAREDYWLRREEFLCLNPAGEVPLLIEEDNLVIADIYNLLEYIILQYDKGLFFPHDKDKIDDIVEIRRLISWLNNKLYREVTKYVINEKLIRLFKKLGAPKSELLRAAKQNLQHHLQYFTYLLKQKEYLAGDYLTICDFVAAAHISVLDYFNEINWSSYERLKHWYSLLKSRPSFRPLLDETIPGYPAPKLYEMLDF